MKYILIALALWIVGGVLAAAVNGYGAYIMVVLDLLGLAVLVVGALRRVFRRQPHISPGG